jgi:hypothetical protein
VDVSNNLFLLQAIKYSTLLRVCGIIRLLSGQQEVQHGLVESSRILQLWSVARLLYDLQPSRPVQRTGEEGKKEYCMSLGKAR